jgi:hypothetical protein
MTFQSQLFAEKIRVVPFGNGFQKGPFFRGVRVPGKSGRVRFRAGPEPDPKNFLASGNYPNPTRQIFNQRVPPEPDPTCCTIPATRRVIIGYLRWSIAPFKPTLVPVIKIDGAAVATGGLDRDQALTKEGLNWSHLKFLEYYMCSKPAEMWSPIGAPIWRLKNELNERSIIVKSGDAKLFWALSKIKIVSPFCQKFKIQLSAFIWFFSLRLSHS